MEKKSEVVRVKHDISKGVDKTSALLLEPPFGPLFGPPSGPLFFLDKIKNE